jgi:hypothetical protein
MNANKPSVVSTPIAIPFIRWTATIEEPAASPIVAVRAA